MKTILDRIVESRRKTIFDEKPDCQRKKNMLSFSKAILEKGFVFEIKKKSPSRGVIKNFDPIEMGLLYERSGCAAISVLTEPEFFDGSLHHLKAVSENVSVPVLCKDFIISKKQIENAYNCGADAILLIASILNKEQLSTLSVFAKDLGLDILFEIHSLNEFEKIKDLNPAIVGVNSRDLKTMKIDLNRCEEIIKELPSNIIKIAESGINTREQIIKLKRSGANGFLIGTSIVSSRHPEKFIERLIHG